MILRYMIASRLTEFEATERCQGYEGSPKGRKRHRDCMHMFKVTIRLAFKDAAAPDSTVNTRGAPVR
jgi:hypothetical protein